MRGAVNSSLEATVVATLRGVAGVSQPHSFVIDTGFTGDLTLPGEAVESLQLTWLGQEEGILADGRAEVFDVYRGEVLWDDHWRPVEIQCASVYPLLGMSLLSGHDLFVRVMPGGSVRIEPVD
jgi:clan AA aspartic protease